MLFVVNILNKCIGLYLYTSTYSLHSCHFYFFNVFDIVKSNIHAKYVTLFFFNMGVSKMPGEI